MNIDKPMKNLSLLTNIVFFYIIVITNCQAQQPVFTSAEVESGAACYLGLNYDPRLAALRSKVGYIQSQKNDRPTLEMLADRTKATREEQALISYWAKARQQCDDIRVRYIQPRVSPEMFLLNRKIMNSAYALYAKLYAGDVTYGEFNQVRFDTGQTYMAAVSELQERERAKRTDSAKAEAAERLLQAQQNQERQAQDVAARQLQEQNAQALQIQQQQLNLQRQRALEEAFKPAPTYNDVFGNLPKSKPSVQTNCRWVLQTWQCSTN